MRLTLAYLFKLYCYLLFTKVHLFAFFYYVVNNFISYKVKRLWWLAFCNCWLYKQAFISTFFTKSHVPKLQHHLLYHCSFIMLHIFVYNSLNLYFYYSLNCCQKALLTRHTACVYYIPVLSPCPSVFACMCTENSCISCRTRNTFIIKYCQILHLQ